MILAVIVPIVILLIVNWAVKERSSYNEKIIREHEKDIKYWQEEIVGKQPWIVQIFADKYPPHVKQKFWK